MLTPGEKNKIFADASFKQHQILTKDKAVKWCIENRTKKLIPVEIEEVLAKEVRVEIYLGDKTVFLEASPHNLDELVLGHACLELISKDYYPVIIKKDEYKFWLQAKKKNLKNDLPRRSTWTIAPEQILTVSEEFRNWPGLWEGTGCFHKAFVWDVQAKTFLFKVEDISRHNCIDRIFGLASQRNFDLNSSIIFISSRVTASLLQKIAKTSLAMVVSLSAVSARALHIARAQGISLIGFARSGRFTVFADGRKRIGYAF